MKLTLLGTAACEGIPSLFCNCDICSAARAAGGREVRTRSQALVNTDVLIDFPADTYAHMTQHRIDASAIGHVLITHSHADHFYPHEIMNRADHLAYGMVSPRIVFYCSETVRDVFEYLMREHHGAGFHRYFEMKVVAPFEPFEFSGYTVTPLPAVHTSPEQSLIYLIENGKSVLYGTDTAYFDPRIIPYLKNSGKTLDTVCLDCTRGLSVPDNGRHMNIDEVVALKNELTKEGVIHANTKVIATHFSHNGKGLAKDLEESLAPHGIIAAYDGLSVEV